jgi:hypothetical protein
MKRRLIQLSVVAVLVCGSFLWQPASTSGADPIPQTGYCIACESDCYQHAENITDYNACIMLCNYSGCNLPTR